MKIREIIRFGFLLLALVFVEESRADSLFDAIAADRVDIVREYLDAGGDPNAVITQATDEQHHKQGWRGVPLEWALYKGNDEIALLLLQAGADLLPVEQRLARPFVVMAAQQGWTRTVCKIITDDPGNLVRGDPDDSPLLEAAAAGHTDMVISMLAIARKYDLDWEGRLGSALVVAASSGREEVANALLDAGADAHVEAALHAAVRNLSAPTVRRLLTNNADADLRVLGVRPLDIAIFRLEREPTVEAHRVFREIVRRTTEPCVPVSGGAGPSPLSRSTVELLERLAPECSWATLVPWAD